MRRFHARSLRVRLDGTSEKGCAVYT